jgi:hypothetical protein
MVYSSMWSSLGSFSSVEPQKMVDPQLAYAFADCEINKS